MSTTSQTVAMVEGSRAEACRKSFHMAAWLRDHDLIKPLGQRSSPSGRAAAGLADLAYGSVARVCTYA